MPPDISHAECSVACPQKIRILLADDQASVRRGLIRILKEEPDMEVVDEAVDGRQAVELVRRWQPDVVIMDVVMPQLNGIQATRIIAAEYPKVRVIGHSMHRESRWAGAMRRAGATAYLPKSCSAKDLISTIRACGAPPGKSGFKRGLNLKVGLRRMLAFFIRKTGITSFS